MNRENSTDRAESFHAAAAALPLLCIALAGCGGGGEGDDRQDAMRAAIASAATPHGSAAVGAGEVPVKNEDIVYNFSAANPDSFRYPTLQCQGTNHYFWTWTGTQGKPVIAAPNPLMSGLDPNGERFAAFSVVDSPDEPLGANPSRKKAFRWELHINDPDTAGANAKRCEFSFGWKEYRYPGKVMTRQIGLPADKDFWWAVAVRPGDTRGTSAADSQMLWQWHDAYGGGLPPFLSLISAGNELQLQVVYDMNSDPRNSTLKRKLVWSSTAWQAGQWMRFVVQARKDMQNPKVSYVKIWLDGQQIVDYQGEFGYLVPQMDYAKVGIYHWISAANPWETIKPHRVLHTKGPVQVDHRDGYTWRSIDALMD